MKLFFIKYEPKDLLKSDDFRQYTRHGGSLLSQLNLSAHGHSIVYWFLSSPTGGISHVLQIYNRYNIHNQEWKKEEQKRTDLG